MQAGAAALVLCTILPRRAAALSRGMASLDRAALAERISVGALVVPAARTGEFMARLRPQLLNLKRTRNVVTVDDKADRKLLLSRALPADGALAALEGDAGDWARAEVAAGRAAAATHVVRLDYDYFTVEEALRRLLPASVAPPLAFETCGHVAHLNLRPEHGPYKTLIAEVMLDKHKTIRTVVNKVGEIREAFRTYELEVLAGDPSTKVSLREQGCVFEFDVRDVYWNSRLQAEHGRLLETIPFGSRVADCTAGVGPFSVPLARSGRATCRANDLNPAAVAALRANAKRNGCAGLEVAEPGCARAFLRDLVSQDFRFTHALFNLPASGVELLDAFRDLDVASWDARPLVHCYAFAAASKGSAADAEAPVADLRARCAEALGAPLPEAANAGRPLASPDAPEAARLAAAGAFVVRWVRNVSPNKDMYCASFLVPESACEGGGKRAKVGD